MVMHQSKPLFYIPTQTLNLYKLFANYDKQNTFTIKQFELSEQVTYKEYKEYLAAVKKDSSEKFYLTQLPDSSIGPLEVYQKYLTLPDYDNNPVIGISWESAMNYCKWKTIKDNNNKHLQFIYRLPNCSEWLAAYYYLKENKIKNTLNQNYSDWLINMKDESHHLIDNNLITTFIYDYTYFHKPGEGLTLKRKRVIGNSYLYQHEYLLAHSFSFYANRGYREVSFRYVKEAINDSDNSGLSKQIINYWGLDK